MNILGFKAIAIHLRFGDMSFNQGNHIILNKINIDLLFLEKITMIKL
jgi:hypothetical protein